MLLEKSWLPGLEHKALSRWCGGLLVELGQEGLSVPGVPVLGTQLVPSVFGAPLPVGSVPSSHAPHSV